jgi:hypothetical protein
MRGTNQTNDQVHVRAEEDDQRRGISTIAKFTYSLETDEEDD